MCNCKSGRKQVGCCIHVASFIYYLSFARYSDIKIPGEYLSSVLIDTANKQSANKPLYARKKRRRKIVLSAETPTPTTATPITTTPTTPAPTTATPITTTATTATPITTTPTTTATSIATTPTTAPPTTATPITTTPTTATPTTTQTTTTTPTTTNSTAVSVTSLISNTLSLRVFEDHLPTWGAEITIAGSKIRVTNTCTIDYFIFSLWVFKRNFPNFMDNMPNFVETSILRKIINNVELFKWNDAREHWIIDIMKLKKPANSFISLYGSEYEMFIKYLLIYQRHDAIQICSDTCRSNKNVINKGRDMLMFNKIGMQVGLNMFHSKKCNNCGNRIMLEPHFVNKPKFVFVESPGNIFLDEIPPNVQLGTSNFKWFCTTLHKRNHFLGVFEVDGKKFIVDDLQQNAKQLPEKCSDESRSGYYDIFTGSSIYYQE